MFISKEKTAIGKQINLFLLWLDRIPLWWMGILIAIVFFLPYFILGDGCIFEINDQLDESIMNYVLSARHLLDGSIIYPEMLGGVNASGMQPSAVLFLPLYCIFPTRIAFLIQYIICFFLAFLGMYLLVKESTDSSILAVIAGSCFSVLPLYPIYGLSEFGIPLIMYVITAVYPIYGLTEFGIPLVIYAFLCFWKRKRFIFAVLSTLLFGLTSHLVCTGYVVLGLWLLAIIIAVILKRKNSWPLWGFGELLLTYMIVNRALILEILIGNSSYVSHREEMISSATPFFETFRSVFLNSSQHAPSLHKYLILPIILFLILGAFCKKEETDRILYKAAVINFFYWLYPAHGIWSSWAAAVLWRTKVPHTDARMQAGKLVVILICLLPTLQLLKVNSGMYLNVNQINNGSGVTGYISWESWFAEDLMQEIDDAIGRDKSTYRVAHLGISPAPSLMHGFYTVDGYSNNYSLEYKHRFREVIAEELEKNEEVRVYFDLWGNRCYLFNSITGNYMQLKKGNTLVYEGLEFDMDALRELGCEYLFSGAEIGDAERMGLELVKLL